jgi:hypothetical protein
MTGMGDKNAIFDVFSRYNYMQIFWAQHIIIIIIITTTLHVAQLQQQYLKNISCFRYIRVNTQHKDGGGGGGGDDHNNNNNHPSPRLPPPPPPPPQT